MAKVFLIIIAAAALVLVACDDSGGDAATDVDTNFIVESTPATAVVPSIIDDGGTTPVVAIDAPPARELLTLFDQGLSATYMATYRTASPDGTAGDSYVVYNAPPFSRIDTLSPGESTPGSRIVAQAGGSTAACSNSGSGWSCDEIDSLGSSAIAGAGGIVYPSAEDLASGTVTEEEPRTVAGQQARCVTLAFEAGGASTYCLNEAGVVLYNEGDFGTVQADTYSTDVSQDDFLLP